MTEKEESNKKLKNEFDYKLLDIALNNYKEQYSRFKDIDTKAIGIITITGILITFLRTSVCVQTIFHVIISISFLITILFCILAIRTRRYESLSVYKIINEISTEYNEENTKRIISTVAKSEKSICGVANEKAIMLRYAIYTLAISIILLIFNQFI